MEGERKMVEMTNDAGYEFRLAEGSERVSALKFIEEWALNSYNCKPPETTGAIIGAFFAGEAVGTISIDFGSVEKHFPLEEIYEIKEVRKILKFNRKKIAQIGRWHAKVPEISLKLIECAAEYSKARGAEFLLCEGKPNSVRRVEQLGLRFVLFYGLYPKLQNIPEDCRAYYEKAPQPKLALIYLDSIIKISAT